MLNKEGKKLPNHHGAVVWVAAVLLGLIVLLLVFQLGFVMGYSSSNYSKHSYSACKGDYAYKKISGHTGEKFSSLKKSAYSKKSVYSNYKGVVKLTNTGFVVKDADGNIEEVVINEDTKMISGKETTESGVMIGDKVYVEGVTDESGQIIAQMIKIYDKDLDEYKK